jgi:uncharacterized membrane protein
MQLEQSTEVKATPEAAWAVLKDVERWPEWTESMDKVEVVGGGPLMLGAKVRIKQPKLPGVQWQVSELDEGRFFAWRANGLGFKTTGSHRVEPAGDGASRVTLSLRTQGPLAGFFDAMIGKMSERYVQMELQGLKRRCEGG